MHTTPIPVTRFELVDIGLGSAQPEKTDFPVVIGTFNELNQFHGDIPKDDTEIRVGLRKPARQHHRSAIVTVDEEPVTIADQSRQLLVTAKGANMSWPHVGLTYDSDRGVYPYTYGLVSVAELGRQFDRVAAFREAGITTEQVVGCFAIQEYIVDGKRMTHEEFGVDALNKHRRVVAQARIPLSEKMERERVIQSYVEHPHVIILRGTEAVLRLGDAQDEPDVHKTEMLERVGASSEPGTENFTLPDYFDWLQNRLGQNISGMQERGYVHRALYHGGNITTNGEIVDLDTVRHRSDYASEGEFEAACQQDIKDAATNIKLLQKAFGYAANVSAFTACFE